MSLADRLKEARTKQGLSQQKLAELINLSRATISQWELEQTTPDGLNLLLCSLKLKINPFYLQFEEDSQYIKEAIEAGIIGNHTNSVPLYDWDNLCATNSEKKVIAPVHVTKDSFALQVEDDSMTHLTPGEPSFPRGTIIIVDPSKKPEHGKFVIAKPKDRPESKPIFRKYNTDYLSNDLIPLNFSSFRMYSADNFDIIGVVVASMYLDL
jgi:SOS-response transcriptional repressor LexA